MIPPGALGDGPTRTLLEIVGWNEAWPPSQRELARALGCTAGTVGRHIRVLRDAGLVAVEPGRARTVRPRVRLASVHDRARRPPTLLAALPQAPRAEDWSLPLPP